MKKLFTVMALAALLASAPQPGHCGKVGGTLARYCLGGAGVGALLGAASATIPYLNSHQGFDFVTGAGVGTLAGVSAGLIFGIIDLATLKDEEPAQQGKLERAPDSQVFAFKAGSATYVAWKTVF